MNVDRKFIEYLLNTAHKSVAHYSHQLPMTEREAAAFTAVNDLLMVVDELAKAIISEDEDAEKHE